MAEMDALGYSINHVLRTMEAKEAFLIALYKEVMEIAVEAINNSDGKLIADTLDSCLQNTNLDYEIRLSIFDYLLNFTERFIVHCKMMRIPGEVKYKFEMKNDSLYTGRDFIKIDVYATYHTVNDLLNRGTCEEITPWKDDVIDNPTSEDFDSALEFDQKIALLVRERRTSQPSRWVGEDVIDEDAE